MLPRPPRPPRCHHGALAGKPQVGDHRAAVDVVHRRARRHAQDQVGAALAVLVLAAPVLAAPGAQRLGIGQVEQGGEAGVDLQHHVAAVAPVAAARASARQVLLPPEARTAVAAVAGFDPDGDFVDELHAARGC